MSPEEKPPACDKAPSSQGLRCQMGADHLGSCVSGSVMWWPETGNRPRAAEEKPKATPMTAEELRDRVLGRFLPKHWADHDETRRSIEKEVLALITAYDAARDAEMPTDVPALREALRRKQSRLLDARRERDEAYRQLHAIMGRICDLDPNDESEALREEAATEIMDVVVEWIEKKLARIHELEAQVAELVKETK